MEIGSQSCSLEEVGRNLDLVQNWVEQKDYRGYEPFDGLSSWARPLALGNVFAERLLMQLIRQCPLNLRPLLGVSPKESTKGRGYMAWGYLSRYRATKRKGYLDKATHCLDWLDLHKVPRSEHHSWSNHFDFVSRYGSYTKDDPIIVWTSLIGLAYLEAFEITAEQRWLRIADSVCRWIMELPRETTRRGACLSYLPRVQCSIHNSNLLGAAMLARTARRTGNREQLQVARSAMEYSCSRQLPDGAWWYAEEAKYHWIDNFHTGYNLCCLKHYLDATEEPEFRGNLESGLKFFKENFFEESGRPKYYHNRTYPVDIQCAAQAIDTLATLGERDPACLALARRVARWTMANMQDREGYFYYRQYPLMTSRTPMLHWGQATMFRALALLYEKLSPASRVESTETISRRRGGEGSWVAPP
jgi:hypothetical protein